MIKFKFKKISRIKKIFKKFFKEKYFYLLNKLFQFSFKKKIFSNYSGLVNFFFSLLILYRKFEQKKKKFPLTNFDKKNSIFKKLRFFSNNNFFFNFKLKKISKKEIKGLLWFFIFRFPLSSIKIIDNKKIISDLIFSKLFKKIEENELLNVLIIKQKKFLKNTIHNNSTKFMKKFSAFIFFERSFFHQKIIKSEDFLIIYKKKKKFLKNPSKNLKKIFFLITLKPYVCFCRKLKFIFKQKLYILDDLHSTVFFEKKKNIFFFFIRYKKKIKEKILNFFKKKNIVFKKLNHLIFFDKIKLSQNLYIKNNNFFINLSSSIIFNLLNKIQKSYLKINKIFFKKFYKKYYSLYFADDNSFLFISKISNHFFINSGFDISEFNINFKRFFLFVFQDCTENFFFMKQYFLKLITYKNIIQKIFTFSFDLLFKIFFQILAILLNLILKTFQFNINLKNFDIYLIFLMIFKNNLGTFLMLKKNKFFFFHFYILNKKKNLIKFTKIYKQVFI